jgi:hypothetical protein
LVVFGTIFYRIRRGGRGVGIVEFKAAILLLLLLLVVALLRLQLFHAVYGVVQGGVWSASAVPHPRV